MKTLFFLLVLTLPSLANGDTIKKWVDEKGVVHYSDGEAAENVEAETLKIENTYDQEAYDEGVKRHQETEKFADEYEKERLTEEKEREIEESQRPKATVPASGGTAIAPYRNRPLQKRPLNPGNNIPGRTVNLPAKIN